MAGIMCVWANLPDEAMDWYLNDYVPGLCVQDPNHLHTIHTEQKPNGMDDLQSGVLDSPWDLFTIYDERDAQLSTQRVYDVSTHPPNALRSGLLAEARLDVRTYREIKRWQEEDWDGSPTDVRSVAAIEWTILPGMEEEVLEFYNNEFVPLLFSSPEVLRYRFFEIDNATVWKSDSYVTKDKKEVFRFFSLMELERDKWPWQELMEASLLDGWKNWFETQNVVRWQVSHYNVKQTFSHPQNKEPDSKETTSDGMAKP